MKRKFILDTDPGIDDVEAILFMLSKPDVEVVAITTLCGNGSADLCFSNTLKILDFIGVTNIPVYKGSECAVDISQRVPDNFFGSDALGNANLPHEKSSGESNMSSAEAIVNYCRKNRGEINLIAIGPLTNVAIALLYDPNLPSYLQSLTAMCGDREKITQHNCCDYAEFNARCDPAALKYVFNRFATNGACPFHVIDWELCQRSPLPNNIFEMIEKNNDPAVNPRKKELLRILEDKTHKGVACRYMPGGFVTADIFAALASYDKSIIKKMTKSELSECHTEGPIKGHIAFKEDEAGKIYLIDELDMDNVIKYFVSIVTN